MKRRIIKIGKYYYPQFKFLCFWRFYSKDWNSGFFTKIFGKGKGNEYSLIEFYYHLYMAENFIKNEIKKEQQKEKNKNHKWCMNHDKIYRDSFYNIKIYEMI